MGGGKFMLVWTESRAMNLFQNRVTSSNSDPEVLGVVAGRSLFCRDGPDHHSHASGHASTVHAQRTDRGRTERAHA